MDVTDKQFNIKLYFIIVLVKCKHEKNLFRIFLGQLHLGFTNIEIVKTFIGVFFLLRIYFFVHCPVFFLCRLQTKLRE